MQEVGKRFVFFWEFGGACFLLGRLGGGRCKSVSSQKSLSFSDFLKGNRLSYFERGDEVHPADRNCGLSQSLIA